MAIVAALALVAGAFGRVALAFAPAEPCHTLNDYAEQSGHVHGAHDAHAQHHQHEQQGKSAPTADACFKCCGICTAAPNLPGASGPADVAFVSYPVAYFSALASSADRPIAIDPGIPKRIA